MQSVQPGMVAPDFAATALDGTAFKLSELRGKVVLLDFWATWCAPCIAELPNLKKIHEKFASDGLTVVSVSFDRQAGTARQFAADKKMGWTQLWAEKADEGPIANLYGVGGIPATFLIGADGKVVARDLRGPEFAKAVQGEIKKLKKDPTEASGAAEVSAVRAEPRPPLPPSVPSRAGAIAAAADLPAALEALEATASRYRSLKSYRDALHCEARLTQKGDEQPQVGCLDGTLAFAAPDRLVSKSDTLHAYYDGLHVMRYWPSARRYTVGGVADLFQVYAPDDGGPGSATALNFHPLATLLALRERPAKETLSIAAVTGIEPETRDGRPGLRLSGRLRPPAALAQDLVPFTAFINEQTKLFEEFQLDLTEATRMEPTARGEPPAESEVERAELVLTFTDVRIDGDIEAAALAFKPGRARRVDTWGSPPELIASPLDLLGQAAPALAGQTLDGPEFDLAAGRGQPALVAFWGTWAPDAQRLLSDLQHFAEQAGQPPLLVIGVNHNGPAGQAAVRRACAQAGVRWPQVLDREGDLAARWHVAALPAVFLVDPRGIIAEAYPAWPTDARETVRRQLDRLRKGEPLYAGEELAARRAQAGDPEQSSGMVLRIPTDTPADERLVVANSRAASGSGNSMREQDVDSDGELELILPSFGGSLCVVKPTTGEVKQVQLQGLEQFYPQSVHGVIIDGETCWLYTGTKFGWGPNGSRQSRSLLRLYSPEGGILWTFSPSLPENTSAVPHAVAGDLNGDGTVEFAIGLSVYEQQPTRESAPNVTKRQFRLFVLDRDGRLIAQRELEGSVELVYVAATPPGQPAPLLCLSNGQLERYVLHPAEDGR